MDVTTLITGFEERFKELEESKGNLQDALSDFCEDFHKQVDDLEDKINARLKEIYTAEADRLHKALHDLRTFEENVKKGQKTCTTEEAIFKASTELAVKMHCSFAKTNNAAPRLEDKYDIKIQKTVLAEYTTLKKPENISAEITTNGILSIAFFDPNTYQENVFEANRCGNGTEYKFLLNSVPKDVKKAYTTKKGDCTAISFSLLCLEAEKEYNLQIKSAVAGTESEWSDTTKFSAPEFSKCCAWKNCPSYVGEANKYSLNKENHMIATKINSNGFGTVIGTAAVPPNRATFWSVKALKVSGDRRGNINVGMAPFDIDQNKRENYQKYGWYFCTAYSTLTSGPPHNYDYRNKEYGPRKEDKNYLGTGGTVGVLMDTTKGELSFYLNGVSLGIGYRGIPLDKPLVPCVNIWHCGDVVELIHSTVPTTSFFSNNIQGAAN